MSRTVRAASLAVAGAAALVVAALNPTWRASALVAAVILLFLSGTSLSRAKRLASALPPLANRAVDARVWGSALPGDAALEVDSIRSFGAGLLIYLRPEGGGARRLLKVAQPMSGRVEPGRLEIASAAYVSWAGERLRRDVDRRQPALVLSWTEREMSS